MTAESTESFTMVMLSASYIFSSAFRETVESLRSRRWRLWAALIIFMTAALAIVLPALIAVETGVWRGWDAEFWLTEKNPILRFSLPFLALASGLLVTAPLAEYLWQVFRAIWQGRRRS